ncbi:MAG: bifunctional demethylmenaquinone methyltransferase/2-methoxy-6-polyprenyl-1,4-benzoquinol methylase UbiE [Bacteroidales bacterium]|nr:bifunctional demethylmenaquinone methyltransferase/2-methoxy-6-polyprenyl-1,4-benzoquinol methylase UbiE [Bacteroidales bacterium]
MAKVTSKKENVRSMFNSIAKRYDFLNHLLSMGIDRLWRKRLVKMLVEHNPETVLDVATGTADLAIAVTKYSKAKITGIDIAEEMVNIGRMKIASLNLNQQIELKVADSENIPFSDNAFDAAIVAFGVRNFETLNKGLSEMNRVLKSGGMIAVLEFSRPRHFPVRNLYMFYFRYILPSLGRMISGDKSAYTYLPDSVKQFPDGSDFLQHLIETGFIRTTEKRLSFGIATIYTGFKA